METLTIVLALGLAVAIAAVGVLWTRLGAARERVEALTAVHDEALRQVRADLDVERQRVEMAQREASEALSRRRRSRRGSTRRRSAASPSRH